MSSAQRLNLCARRNHPIAAITFGAIQGPIDLGDRRINAGVVIFSMQDGNTAVDVYVERRLTDAMPCGVSRSSLIERLDAKQSDWLQES